MTPGRPAIAPYLIAKSMRDGRAIGPVDDVLRDQCASRPPLHEPRHYRIGGDGWDFLAGAFLGFLVGFAPFLLMLAWMEWAR